MHTVCTKLNPHNQLILNQTWTESREETAIANLLKMIIFLAVMQLVALNKHGDQGS